MLNVEESDRLSRILISALGSEASGYLQEPSITEIRVNTDGFLWIVRQGVGKQRTAVHFEVERVKSLIGAVAFGVHSVCNEKAVSLQAELPAFRARFQAVHPPAVSAPIFAIRKKAPRIWSLEDFVNQGVLTSQQAAILRRAVLDRQNIIVAGGTDTGKTTFANALLSIIAAETSHRVVIIEDTQELQCDSIDTVYLRTVTGAATMRDHVATTMRLSPDRIIIGEVRGGEALDLLKAWGTGHAGGVGTVHASGSHKALGRLEQLCLEAMACDPRPLIGDAINCVVYLEKDGSVRRVKEILKIRGYQGGVYDCEAA